MTCYIPETPRKPPGTYVPYIFDENEWNRIIMGADNLADSLKQTKTDMPNRIPDAGQDAVCVWSACVRSAFIKSRWYRFFPELPFRTKSEKWYCHRGYRNFNSRPHEEVDKAMIDTGMNRNISTHDLTKRSTILESGGAPLEENFNSRPHEEVDIVLLLNLYQFNIFQLTTSRRGRHAERITR